MRKKVSKKKQNEGWLLTLNNTNVMDMKCFVTCVVATFSFQSGQNLIFLPTKNPTTS